MSPFKCQSNQKNFKAKPNTSTIPADPSQGKEDETYKTANLDPKPNCRHVASTQGKVRPGIPPPVQIEHTDGKVADFERSHRFEP